MKGIPGRRVVVDGCRSCCRDKEPVLHFVTAVSPG